MGLLVVVALTSSGCVELTQDLEIHRGGSGVLRVHLEWSRLLEQMAGDEGCPKLAEPDSFVRVVERRSFPQGGTWQCFETVEFDRPEALSSVGPGGSGIQLAIEPRIFKDRYRFVQHIEPDAEWSGHDAGAGALAQGVTRGMLGELRWFFRVQLPGRVLSNNASSFSGNDLLWSPTVLDVFERGVRFEAVSEDWNLLRLGAAGAGGLLVIVAIAGMGLSRARRHPPAKPAQDEHEL